MPLYGSCLRAKRTRRVSFTLLEVIDRTYIIMSTNSSSLLIICSVTLSQGELKNLSNSVTFLNTFQPAILSFYLSQQVELCIQVSECMKERQSFDLGPNDLTMSWTGIHLKSLPFPNVTHKSSIFKSSKRTTLITTSICIRTYHDDWIDTTQGCMFCICILHWFAFTIVESVVIVADTIWSA